MELELPIITTERLILRLGTPEDIPAIIQYFTDNKTYLTPFYPTWQPGFFTEEYWQNQVEMSVWEFVRDRSLRLLIVPKVSPHLVIGVINFHNFVRGAAQYCTVGYSLAETQQGKGYMHEALTAANNYLFQVLKMHRIMANYMPHNQRSGQLLKRLGFIPEGYARDFLLINGEWQDHILTSLVNPQWQASSSY
ncbi:GNAT family N-acetyltransferase [Calothrix sp. 336/3]|uniref:GNAT family N-acetyltransferase n=1 Tax=Calothrix sp. 336/3 TaxID=1337936 RepID=UPI0004E41E63|nr:GNAT family N-acetyltransferase [Calothrix sp. 336/3]AKG23814.1 alanine acetyltransferase [Calothrix sp. 336/3]